MRPHNSIYVRRCILATVISVSCAAHVICAGENDNAPRLLAVLAHPDDETVISGALLRAMQAGYDVRVVYATSGAQGRDKSGRGLTGAALGREREREVCRALQILGVSQPPVLLRLDERLLSRGEEFAAAVERVFQEYLPNVVITFGVDGFTGHNEHQYAGLITTRVFDKLGIAAELYYAAMPRAFALTLPQKLRERMLANAVADSVISAKVEYGSVLDVKFNAAAAHATQFSPDELETMKQAYGRRPVLEWYVRARGPFVARDGAPTKLPAFMQPVGGASAGP